MKRKRKKTLALQRARAILDKQKFGSAAREDEAVRKTGKGGVVFLAWSQRRLMRRFGHIIAAAKREATDDKRDRRHIKKSIASHVLKLEL